MKIIDLSITISERVKEPMLTKIEYEDHIKSASNMAASVLGCNIDKSIFLDGYALSAETVTLTTHSGTHVDAPYHYYPTSEGKPARTIDEMPLEWYFNDGVVLDFTDKPPCYQIEIADLKEKLAAIAYTLKPLDIVLIRCDATKKIYDEDFVKIHVGVSAAATHWLIDQGIKVMGTDGWSWDTPLHAQLKEYRANPRQGIVWAAHYVGKEKEYCQIEKLANLDKLPPFGFKVACFPTKIEKASAGWTRAVAIFEDK